MLFGLFSVVAAGSHKVALARTISPKPSVSVMVALQYTVAVEFSVNVIESVALMLPIVGAAASPREDSKMTDIIIFFKKITSPYFLKPDFGFENFL